MTDKVKKKTAVVSKDTKVAIKNLVRLTEALAILTVSTFAGIVAYGRVEDNSAYWLVVASAVLIGLRGAELFIKHLANK
jgi:predicted small integral membrane protein